MSRGIIRLFLPPAAWCVLLVMTGCTVGPNYQRPTVATTPSFKELDNWRPARPRQAASGSPWWTIYDDATLDQLEKQIEISNQTLKASEAAYREARAVVREARAGYFPSVSIGASGQRTGQTLSRSGRVVQNQFDLTPTASWEPDLWGRLRREVESDVANAQASAADLAAARLAAQSQLATDYLQLRIDDELKRVLATAVEGYRKSLDITRNQYNAGTVARTDVITAQTQLEGTEAQEISVGVQRAALEHAIAVLTGKPPAAFAIAPTRLNPVVPVMPPGVPSALLERRPDIAAAERAVAAANAQIGVAESAYFPTVTLSASYGFANAQLANLIEASSSVWSFGGAASETLFSGGLRGAQVEAARAAYDQNVANYRQTVLAAFQQVEDELAALRILEDQARVEDSAVKSSHEAVNLTLNQYQAGTVAYTSVVVAQATELADEEAVLNILASRLAASVTLIEALGGGWNDKDLPSPAELAQSQPHTIKAEAGAGAGGSAARLWEDVEKWFNGN